jgi:hypothetical protein
VKIPLKDRSFFIQSQTVTGQIYGKAIRFDDICRLEGYSIFDIARIGNLERLQEISCVQVGGRTSGIENQRIVLRVI